MVEIATEVNTGELEEVQKPILFDYNKKMFGEYKKGQEDIPQLTDEDCVIIREHTNSIDSVAVNPVNENEFITGSHDHTIMIWDAVKMKMVKHLKGNAQGIWNLNYTQNGKNFVSSSPEGVCKLWDARSGKEVSKYNGHEKARCYKAMLNNSDTQLATCGSDKRICIWDLRKAAKPLLVNTESESCVMACDWAAD